MCVCGGGMWMGTDCTSPSLLASVLSRALRAHPSVIRRWERCQAAALAPASADSGGTRLLLLWCLSSFMGWGRGRAAWRSAACALPPTPIVLRRVHRCCACAHVGVDARRPRRRRFDGRRQGQGLCRPRPQFGLQEFLEAPCTSALRRVRRSRLLSSCRARLFDVPTGRLCTGTPATCGIHLWLLCAPQHKSYAVDFHGMRVALLPEP